MKTYKTIVFTEAMLDEVFPCERGKADKLRFLPAKLSTDPIENVGLAIDIAEHARSTQGSWCDIGWLVSHVGAEDGDFWPDAYCFDNDSGNPDLDAWVVAQWLAWIADKLLTKAGR